MNLRAISAPIQDMWRKFRPALWAGLVAISGWPPCGVSAPASGLRLAQGGCPHGRQLGATPNSLWSGPERCCSKDGLGQLCGPRPASVQPVQSRPQLLPTFAAAGHPVDDRQQAHGVVREWDIWMHVVRTPRATLLGLLLPRPHLISLLN